MTFKIQIASGPHREKVVAEVWWKDENICEVYENDLGGISVEIYPRQKERFWDFDVNDFVQTLNRAKDMLG